MIIPGVRETNIEKIQKDLEFLIQCFREVLEEIGESELAQRLSQTNGAIETCAKYPKRTAQAYSIAFHLLIIAEENAAMQMVKTAYGVFRM